jgi:hypothetical protein
MAATATGIITIGAGDGRTLRDGLDRASEPILSHLRISRSVDGIALSAAPRLLRLKGLLRLEGLLRRKTLLRLGA